MTSSEDAEGTGPLASLRDVKITGQFRRDFRREKRGRHRRSIEADLATLVGMLADDTELPARYVDHARAGQWQDHGDCHLKPDLVLIYRKVDPRPRRGSAPDRPALHLVRLGSHSELGI